MTRLCYCGGEVCGEHYPDCAPASADAALQRFEDEAREVERLRSVALDLDDLDRMQDDTRLEEIGIVNRQSARKAGLRNRKRERKMMIPNTSQRRRRRRR
jgi:hypothetical protein